MDKQVAKLYSTNLLFFPQINTFNRNVGVIIGSMNAINLTIFEKILIFAGLLFFANVIYIASGGDFTLLYAAKGVYLFGIALLLFELLTTKS
ncbi:MAG: hypothetical protein WD552_01850 [Candidatus Paceibacterota bacterium]